MYTVDNKHWHAIMIIIGKRADSIEWVKLFGSRVRGDVRVTSDIDLAVSGNAECITKLAIELMKQQHWRYIS